MCLVSCITRCSRWPCYTSMREGLLAPHCCPQIQTAAPVICPDLQHTHTNINTALLTISISLWQHADKGVYTDRAVGRSAGWQPWRAGWDGEASRAVGECDLIGCGPLSDSAEKRSGAADLVETSAGSSICPESPVPADHRSLEESDRHERKFETVF